jgi:hypothetical protein
MMIVLSALIVAVAVAAFVYLRYSAARFDGDVQRLRLELFAHIPSDAKPSLPDTVRNFALKAGGQLGAPTIIHARHKATLMSKADGEEMPLLADQWTHTSVSGLVWYAQARMGVFPVAVLDAYVQEKGILSACTFKQNPPIHVIRQEGRLCLGHPHALGNLRDFGVDLSAGIAAADHHDRLPR